MSNINPYASEYAAEATPAAFADESARAGFIRRTYLHLAAAVFALVAIEAVIFAAVPAETIGPMVQRMGGMGWLIVLGAFMGVSWLARMWAHNGSSRAMQYAGLSLYVVAEAVILLPLLYVAINFVDPKLPITAAIITLVCFGGLTAFVFFTRVDLASWGKFLALAGLVAMGAVVASIFVPGISFMGVGFSAVMIALACGYILYDTSNVLHHYHTEQHVAAALALFSSVVLLFWYVLRLMMILASEE